MCDTIWSNPTLELKSGERAGERKTFEEIMDTTFLNLDKLKIHGSKMLNEWIKETWISY